KCEVRAELSFAPSLTVSPAMPSPGGGRRFFPQTRRLPYMSRLLTSRLIAIAITVFSTVAMLGVSFEAEAQRRLGGSSMGRQSSNVMQQRQAVQPPAASGAAA